MTQPPKSKEKTEPENRDPEKVDSWEEDQEERSYYYDDAHGYEVYVPEDEDDSETASEEGR
ncbi:MAG: hypothetical protein IPG58_07785 [Acidobacteria bacterium]|nr:hypothetical protein [Acidobacteriota bacterium]